MSRSRFDVFFPAFRAATIAGLALALLGGCETQPAAVAVLGPADAADIEMTPESMFGPIALAEIEITAATIQSDTTEADGFASVEVPTESASRRAASAWLAGMERAAKTPAVAKASAREATSASFGASGGGVGLTGTDFAESPPSHFAPRRKTIASRGPAQVAETGIASIATEESSSASTGVTRGLSRSYSEVQQAVEPLTPAMIKTTVARQMGKVRACYERGLKSEEGLSGKLVMAWKIKSDGSVRSVSIARDELGADKVSMCVVDAVSSFKFPQGTETVSIEYPMNFKAESSW